MEELQALPLKLFPARTEESVALEVTDTQLQYLKDVRDKKINPVIDDYIFQTKPYDHQVRMFEWGRRLPNCAFLSEMGTGKTKAAIDVATYRIETKRIERILVVCPLSVMGTWDREIAVHGKPDLNRRIMLLGSKKERVKRLTGMYPYIRWFIVNYDGVRILMNELMQYKFDMVIADESIAIKNHTAERTRSLIAATINSTYRMILTGLPITQNFLDLWSQYAFLDRGKTLGRSFYSFRRTYFYSVNHGQVAYWECSNSSQELIKELVFETSIKYLKSQCLDLPKKVYVNRYVSMTLKQAGIYKDMQVKLVASIMGEIAANPKKMTASVIIVKLLRLAQITAGLFASDEEDSSDWIGPVENDPKNQEILEIIQQSDDQFVIWCRFQKEVTGVSKFLNDNNIKSDFIYGAVSQENREKRIDAWRNEEIRVLVCQVQTLQYGVTLIPKTKGITVIRRTQDYSLSNKNQSDDRTHRAGLDELYARLGRDSIMYINLLVPRSIDSMIDKIVSKKQDIANCLMDNVSPEVISDFCNGGKEGDD